MAWFWSKESDKIKEKIEEKKEEIKECKTIKMRISAVGDLLDGVPGKLSSAYSAFYGGGYIDEGKSIDADNMNGTGKSRINSLRENVSDIIDRIGSFSTKVSSLITTKESELKTLERQHEEALKREAEKANGNG